MSDQLTFRDFAGAIMGNDTDRAGVVLEALLGVGAAAGKHAAMHFQAQMTASPDFMMKAMAMRSVVQDGGDAALEELLGECFGLEGPAVAEARACIRTRYA